MEDSRDTLDFQALVLQLTPSAMATQACMVHAAKASATIAQRLEDERLKELRTRWTASLSRGRALTKAAY